MKTVLVVIALCVSLVGQAAYSGHGQSSGSVLYAVVSSTGNTINAASCSQANVQTAFNAATHDGDIVSVPAGSCTWTSAVTPPCASWTLEGAGAGSTNITVNNSGGNGLSLSCSGKSTRITGFTWTRQATSPSGMFYLSGNPLSFRIDHNTINQVSSWGRWMWVEGACGSPGCVVDHNTISSVAAIVSAEVSSDTTGCVNTSPINADNCAGTTEWLQPMVLDQGTKEVYFEDNSFTWSSSFKDNDMLDCQNGGRYVFRHNTVNGNDIFGHGYDSVSNSCLEMTVYQNTMTVNNTDAPGAVLYRGGTGVVYDNIMPTSSHYAGYISIQNYRSNSGGANTCALGRLDCHLCNGTNAYDGNVIGGWPCRQGPGRGSDATSGLASYPLYEWDNCPTSVPCAVASQRTPVTDISDSYSDFAANRDWYDAISPFTGAAGIGSGVYSSIPGTCTAGVAYWATDQNKLYQCGAGNSWSVYYTPYTYPHPLQEAGNPNNSSTGVVSLPAYFPSWGAHASTADTNPYSATAPATWGNLTGAGTVVTPTDFSRPIGRCTDYNTVTSSLLWGTADNGELNLFAPDDSFLILKLSGQTRYIMAFNPVTMACTYSGLHYANQAVSAEHTSNSKVTIQVSDTQIYEDTLPVPLSSCAPSCTQPSGANHVLLYDFLNANCLLNAYAGNPSWSATNWTGVVVNSLDDSTYTVAFADQNQTGRGEYVATWKRSYGPSGGCDLWNTTTGAILTHTGAHLTDANSDTFYNHEAFQTLNNDYALVSTSSQSTMIHGTYAGGYYVWQVGTANVVHCGFNTPGPYCDGHEGSGYANLVSGNSSGIHAYADPNASNPTTTLLPVAANCDQHYSWNYDNATDSYPPLATYQDAGSSKHLLNMLGGGMPPGPYYDEMAMVYTDGSGTSRVAHTFDSGWSWQFEVQNAIGIESSSGKFAMWPSDGWGQFGSTSGAASCNIGGPDWAKNDSTDFTTGTGFGSYIMPQSSNSGHYIFQVQSCSGSCATGATEPSWATAQTPSATLTDNTITWVNTGNVSNCRSDILIVKLTR